MIKTKLAAAAALLVAGAISSQAGGLDGSTVDLSYYFPDTLSLYEDNGTFTVPTGDTIFFGQVEVSVTDNQLFISSVAGTLDFTSATFNGVVLTILSGPAITSATVDASSTFDPAGLSIVGGDQLWVNLQSTQLNDGDEAIIDINSVPDGGLTVAMLGSALTGLAFIRRKF